ncbi:hypothetical protein JOQ06_018718, partial [Pogonophryne albipinna]
KKAHCKVCLVLWYLTSITHQGKTLERCLSYAASMLCDLPVRRMTWVLLIGPTPTDRRLTLE